MRLTSNRRDVGGGVEIFSALAIYNAERSRGIVHTAEWIQKMEREQELYDRLHGIGQDIPRDSGMRTP